MLEQHNHTTYQLSSSRANSHRLSHVLLTHNNASAAIVHTTDVQVLHKERMKSAAS